MQEESKEVSVQKHWKSKIKFPQLVELKVQEIKMKKIFSFFLWFDMQRNSGPDFMFQFPILLSLTQRVSTFSSCRAGFQPWEWVWFPSGVSGAPCLRVQGVNGTHKTSVISAPYCTKFGTMRNLQSPETFIWAQVFSTEYCQWPRNIGWKEKNLYEIDNSLAEKNWEEKTFDCDPNLYIDCYIC